MRSKRQLFVRLLSSLGLAAGALSCVTQTAEDDASPQLPGLPSQSADTEPRVNWGPGVVFGRTTFDHVVRVLDGATYGTCTVRAQLRPNDRYEGRTFLPLMASMDVQITAANGDPVFAISLDDLVGSVPVGQYFEAGYNFAPVCSGQRNRPCFPIPLEVIQYDDPYRTGSGLSGPEYPRKRVHIMHDGVGGRILGLDIEYVESPSLDTVRSYFPTIGRDGSNAKCGVEGIWALPSDQ